MRLPTQLAAKITRVQTDAKSIFSLIAVILAVAMMQMADGALQSPLSIRLAVSGSSSFDTGLISTSYAIGFMSGCFVAPPLSCSLVTSALMPHLQFWPRRL